MHISYTLKLIYSSRVPLATCAQQQMTGRLLVKLLATSRPISVPRLLPDYFPKIHFMLTTENRGAKYHRVG